MVNKGEDDNLNFGKPETKDETGHKSMDMTEDENLIASVGDCKEDHKSGMGSFMDMELFSYDSSSLAHYDSKNPDSAKWKTQRKMKCMLMVVVCLGVFALVVIISLS